MNYIGAVPDFIIDDDFIEINNQSNIDCVNRNLLNAKISSNYLDCLKICNCSDEVVKHVVSCFSNHKIETLKLVSFVYDGDLVKILSSLEINEIDFENFFLDSKDFSFLSKLQKGKFTFYKKDIGGIKEILTSVGNSKIMLEFNLGLKINSRFETWVESTSYFLDVCDLMIQQKSQIDVFTIDYDSVPDSIFEQLIEFTKNNSTIRIFQIPVILTSRNLVLRLFDALQSCNNLEMFLTNGLLFDEEVYNSVLRVVDKNTRIWYFAGNWEGWYSRFIQYENPREKLIYTKLRENDNKRD